MDKQHIILVIYIGIQGIRSEDIERFTSEIAKKIAPAIEGEIIVIPTQSPFTTIECINPKYITDVDLINEHTVMMNKLKENLQNQLEQIKEEENG